uniref:Protein phosphatase 1 regulatory subunit 35 C-terminal domain-containing protein n=1 Tax=Ascaris lumbricoides TaxID=6252 RepID=A0A0M3IT72_ASCLU
MQKSQKSDRTNVGNKRRLLEMKNECPTQEATNNLVINITQATNSIQKIVNQKGPIIKPQPRVVKRSAIGSSSGVSLNVPQKTLKQTTPALSHCINLFKMDIKQEEIACEMDATQPLSDIKPFCMNARLYQRTPISPSSSTKKTSSFRTVENESEKTVRYPLDLFYLRSLR